MEETFKIIIASIMFAILSFGIILTAVFIQINVEDRPTRKENHKP